MEVFSPHDLETPVLEVFSDADWAADRDTRRSVSGSTIFYGVVERRVRNVCCCFSHHGRHPHSQHHLMATSVSVGYVFIPILISCTWHTCKKGSRKTRLFEQRSFVEAEFGFRTKTVGEVSFRCHQSSLILHKTFECCKTAVIKLLPRHVARL